MSAQSALIFFFFIFFFGTSSWAQFDDPVEYTMPEELNTIGFNVTPLVILAMNSDQYSPRWSFLFKRQNQPNSKVRIQVNLETRDKYDLIQRSSPLAWTDTTITVASDTRKHTNQDIRFGMEFFKPNEKNSMIYGFDAGVGIWSEFDEEVIVPYWNDPELANQPVPSPFESSRKVTSEVTWAYAVLDFSVGHKFNANSNFNFILQWTPEVIYQWPVQENYSNPDARSNPPSDAFFFRLRGIELFMNVVF